ncbi:hypothetical protein ACFLU1_06195 [Chloroflexota bacterium]
MKPIIILCLILVSLLIGGCAPSQDFDARLNSIVKPYRFSIAAWELRTIPQETGQWLFGEQEEINDEFQVVTDYFTSVKRIKTLKSEIAAANASDKGSVLTPLEDELDSLQERKIALAGTVEKIINKQIKDILTQQGIFNPVAELEISFPPVSFKLEELPHLLVISPRDKIESMKEIVLEQSLLQQEKEAIEAKADGLGVSSLVVGLGGIATYPALVDSEASLRFTIDTTTEEWLHQYLAFKPLGFLYVLDLTGLSRNYEIATINESLAGMVSKEIGAMVYEKYYSEYENDVNQMPESEFDFNLEMREIRKTVDAYLSRGEIKQAEEFMEQKRQYLVSMGHYIRKLNQAYFAFHGTYAHSVAFISPIGVELRELRDQSASLKDFLDTVSVMTSRQELKDSIR